MPGDWSHAESVVVRPFASVDDYLSGSPQGFERMMWALLQLEIEYGPDGNPVITPEGRFNLLHLDHKQRTVLERFLSWQRSWHLWPRVEYNIRASQVLTEEQRQYAMEAIKQTQILLGEDSPQAGVC